jgi:hypothetical protein
LIVSADSDVRLAVISVGGILGLGAKTIAIPFEEFEVAPDGATLYLSLTEDDLRARPAFDLEGTNAPAPSTPAERASTQPTSERNELAALPAETHDASLVEQQHAAAAHESGTAAAQGKATKQPASALIGAEVMDRGHLPIGRITDLIVTAEPPDVQVVVELSGASGVSARFVAVPLGELAIPRGHGEDPHRQIETVEMALTVEELEVLPR